jgi:plastocyanin
MQSRYLYLTLAAGFLPVLTSHVAIAQHGRACGSSYYGGPVYYATPATVYYAPPRSYAAPMYSRSYQPSRPMYGQPYSAAPLPAPSRSAPPARQPTTVVNVVMNDNNFQPKSINVQPGTTVRWTNGGTHAHTVTAKNDSWDSGDIPPGATYSATFQQAGTYDYYCRHHNGMEGAIVVGSAAANSASRLRSSSY